MSFWEQVKEGAATVVGEAQKAVNKGSTTIKTTWENFEVICPECASTLVPPTSSKDFPAFECGNCQTLLKTPTAQDKTMFYAEFSVNKVGNKFDSIFGSKQFVSVNVIVPAGKQGGDKIQVAHDGGTYQVDVPPGKHEGDTFAANLDITEQSKPKKKFVAKRADTVAAKVVDSTSQPAPDSNPTSDDATGRSESERLAEKIYNNQI